MVRVEQVQVELSDRRVMFGPPKTHSIVRSIYLPAHAMGEVRGHLAKHVDPERNALLFTDAVVWRSDPRHALRRGTGPSLSVDSGEP